MLTVKSVQPNTVGAELGIEAGDRIKSFNGREMNDLIDYLYCDSLDELVLTVLHDDGETDCEIEKDDGETLGLTFVEKLPTRTCSNKCLFCFVDQLPRGMRRTLYVKDDDWRWSMISGNYVTLTNLTDADFERILDYRISPLYISVHAIDPARRQELICNERADILPRLKRLAAADIRFHAQIVVVPGLNDGAELAQTIDALRPLADTLAVVPVGQTKHRKSMLPTVTKEIARDVIALCDGGGINRFGDANWVMASDEFYMRAELPVPPYERYGDFPQIENGVGLVAKLAREFEDELCRRAAAPVDVASKPRAVDLATGVDSYELMTQLADKLKTVYPSVCVRVHRIVNDFFGHSITVSGLIVGNDLISQCRGKLMSDTLLIPSVMVRDGGSVFLDDVTVAQAEAALGVKIAPSPNDGAALVSLMSGIEA